MDCEVYQSRVQGDARAVQNRLMWIHSEVHISQHKSQLFRIAGQRYVRGGSVTRRSHLPRNTMIMSVGRAIKVLLIAAGGNTGQKRRWYNPQQSAYGTGISEPQWRG